MAKAKQGDTVHIHYTGRLDDGTVFDSSDGLDPLSFTLGQGQVIPGFEKAVEGMEEGEKSETRIPAEEAYGPRSEDLVMSVPRTQLPEDMAPQVGDQLEMSTADGQRVPVRVASTSDDAIEIDANHPLAGEALTFDLSLVKID